MVPARNSPSVRPSMSSPLPLLFEQLSTLDTRLPVNVLFIEVILSKRGTVAADRNFTYLSAQASVDGQSAPHQHKINSGPAGFGVCRCKPQAFRGHPCSDDALREGGKHTSLTRAGRLLRWSGPCPDAGLRNSHQSTLLPLRHGRSDTRYQQGSHPR